jgi:hypothetical protein
MPGYGDALLAGLIRCERCGRKLTLRYSGMKHHIPRCTCSRAGMDNSGPHCIVFVLHVDNAIEESLLGVVGPGAIAAATAAAKEARERRDQVRDALSRDLQVAKRRAMLPTGPSGNTMPLTQRTGWWRASLARWNRALVHVAEVEGKLAAHDARTPAPAVAPASLGVLASNLRIVWSALTTDARVKKRIVRTPIREVVADIDDAASEIVLIVHWVGWRPLRVALAEAPARRAQQHLFRYHPSRASAGADRQRRSDCRPPQPQRSQEG